MYRGKNILAILAVLTVVLAGAYVLNERTSDESDAAIGDTFTTDNVTGFAIKYEITKDSGSRTVKIISAPTNTAGALDYSKKIVYAGNQYTVTAIGDKAFENCVKLVSVNAPSVDDIGKRAFYGCSSLSEVAVKSGVKIGDYAFYNCINLVSITPSVGINQVGSYAFSGCSSLKEVTLLMCSSVGEHAYEKCVSLTTVTYALSSIPAYAFYGCTSLNSFTFYNVSTANIGDRAFYQCDALVSLEGSSITIGSIGEYAFYACDNLEMIEFEAINEVKIGAFAWDTKLQYVYGLDAVRSIGNEAFSYCRSFLGDGNDGELSFGTALEVIGSNVFNESRLIEKYVIDGGNTHFKSVNDVIYTIDGKELVLVPAGKTGSLSIPSGTVTVKNNSFYYSSLASVSIPASVKSIEGYPFDRCTSLTTLTVDSDNSVYESKDNLLYLKGRQTLIACPAGISGPIEIDDNTVTIDDYAFHYSKVTVLTISANTTEIKDQAFLSANALTKVIVKDGNPKYASDSNGLLYDVSSGTRADLIVCPGAISNVVIPDTVAGLPVKKINDYAFYERSNLSSISIGNNVEEIGKYAFYNCNNLASVTIPNSVKKIGEYCFYECDGLTSITIGSGLEELGYRALLLCRGLQTITVSPDNNHYASDGGILYNKEKTILILCPVGVTSAAICNTTETIEEYAFYRCENLREITIPGSVKLIKQHAFDYCYRVTTITFEDVNKDLVMQSEAFSLGILTNRTVCEVFQTDVGFLDKYSNSYTTFTYHVMMKYDLDGGSGEVPASVSKTPGTQWRFADYSGTKDGYDFVGWYIVTDGVRAEYTVGQENYQFVFGVTNNVIHAWWVPHSYFVSFNANGGTASTSMPSQKFTYDVPQMLSANIYEKRGYHFDGWFCELDGKTYKDGAEILNLVKDNLDAEHPIEFKAVWTPNEYTVTFNKHGSDKDPSIPSKKVTFDSTYGDLATIERTGYTFAGWYTSEDVIVQSTSKVDIVSDQVLYAHWTPNEYQVIFIGNNSTSGEMGNQTLIYDAAEVSLTKNVYSRTGYTFVGWNTQADGKGHDYADEAKVHNLATSGSFTLYAQWEAKTYTVTFDKTSGDSVSPGTKVVTYDQVYGDLATSAKKGWKFLGWFTAATGGDEVTKGTTVKITANQTLYAHWEANGYTVVFHANNGTEATLDQSFTYGSGAKPLTANGFVRTGYVFKEWNTSEDGKGTAYADKQSVSDLVTDGEFHLYAQWTPNKYTVTFDKNDSDAVGSMKVQSFIYDVEQKLDNIGFSKIGYTFAGWATSKEGSVVYANQADVKNLTSKVDGSVTLYAIWSANKYTIHFDKNDPLAEGKMDDEKFTYDVAQALSDVIFTKTGYHLKGWAKEDNKSAVVYTPGQTVKNILAAVDGEITLYAVWEANAYKVVFNKNDAKAIGTMTDQPFIYDGSKNLSKLKYSKEGYTFVGWAKSAEGDVEFKDEVSVSNLTVVKDGTVILYAKWAPNHYKVRYDNNSGTGEMDDQPFIYDQDKTALAANTFTKTGYTFQGWATSPTGNKVYADKEEVQNLSSSDKGVVTLYAVWQANVYTVTFDKTSGESVDPITKGVTYDGTYGDLPVPLKTGYTFTGWFTASSGGTQIKSTDTVKITASTTYYAHWVANDYTIRFLGNGNTGGATADQPMKYDQELTALRANGFTKTGYTFIGWKDAEGNDYTNEKEVQNLISKPDGIFVLTAQWKANNYTVHFDINSGDGGSMSDQTLTYDAGKIKLIKNAFTKTGYTFIGWKDTEGNDYSDEEEVLNLTDKGTFTLSAQWRANTYTVTFDKNGSNNGPDWVSIVVTYDQAYSYNNHGLPNNTYTSHDFKGWFTASKGGDEVKNDTVVKITDNQTLYAHWDEKPYHKVTFTDPEDDPESPRHIPTQKDTIEEGGFILPNYPDGGVKFVGWYCVKDEIIYPAGSVYTMPIFEDESKEGIIFKAHYSTEGLKEVVYHINKGSEDTINGWVEPGREFPLDSGSSFEITGYKFTKWNTKADGTGVDHAAGETFEMPDAKVDLYAQWTPITYTVIYHSKLGTTSSATEDLRQTATYDQSYTAIANPFYLKGYTEIMGWVKDNDLKVTKGAVVSLEVGDKGTYSNLASSDGAIVDLYPVWIANEFHINFARNDSPDCPVISGAVADVTATYDAGTKAPENEFVRFGYDIFVEWNTQKDGKGISIKELASIPNLTDENGAYVDLYAIWAINEYHVAFESNGGTDVPTQNGIEHGASATEPSAPTRDGYYFKAWYIDEGLTQVYRFSDKITYKFGTETAIPNDGTVTLYAGWFKLVTAPKAETNLVYTSNELTGVILPVGVVYEISGNTATSAGDYSATVTILDLNRPGYMWDAKDAKEAWVGYTKSFQAGSDPWNESEGYTLTQSVSWTIAKAQLTVSIAGTVGSFVYDGTEHTLDQVISSVTFVETTGTNLFDVSKVTGTKSISATVVKYVDDIVSAYAMGLTPSTFGYNDKNVTMTYVIGTDGAFTVNPKNISSSDITLGDALTYNSKPQSQTLSKVEILLIEGKAEIELVAGVDYVLSNNTQTLAGTYSDGKALIITGKGNYCGTNSKEFTIAKAQLTVSITGSNASYVYDGTAHTLTQAVDATAFKETTQTGLFKIANVTGSKSVTATDVRFDGTSIAPYHMGLTATTFGYNDDNITMTYVIASDGELTIRRLSIESSVITLGDALTYNGLEQTQTVSSVTIGDLAVTYELSDNMGTDSTAKHGKYLLTITGTGNYIGTNTKEFVIAQAELSIDSNKSVDYDGKSTWSVTTVGQNSQIVQIQITADDHNAGAAKAITASTVADKNYLEDVVIGGKTVTVNKVGLTITIDKSQIYTGKVFQVGYSSYNSVVGLVGGDNLTGGTVTTVSKDVGTYSAETTGWIQADLESTKGITNYNVSYVVSLKILAKSLLITIGEDKVYDGSVFVVGYGKYHVKGLVDGDFLNGGTVTTSSKNVKEYTVESEDWVPADLSSEMGIGNYAVTYRTVSLEITKATVVVTPVSGQHKTYNDGADPEFTYLAPVIVTGEVPAFGGSLDRVNGQDAGDYALGVGSLVLVDNGTFLASNYNLFFTEGVQFTIDKAKVVLSASENKDYDITRTYNYQYPTGVGSEKLSLTYTANAVTAGTYTYSKEAAAGKYTVAFADYNGAKASNYELAETYAAEFIINKVDLTLTVLDREIKFDVEFPYSTSNQLSAIGFVGEETYQNLGGTLGFGSEYVRGDAEFGKVGTYVVKASGYVSDNYNISYVDGTLTVKCLTIIVAGDSDDAIVYDSKPHSISTYAVTGDLVDGHKVNATYLVSGTHVWNGTDASGHYIGAFSKVGDKVSYTITNADGTKDFTVNYEVTWVVGSITIHPVDLDLENQFRIYDATTSYTVAEAGAYEKVTLAYTMTSKVVGTYLYNAAESGYAVEIQDIGDTNYRYNYRITDTASAELVIEQRAITISEIPNLEKIYDGVGTRILTIDITGGIQGTDRLFLTSNATYDKNVGVQTMHVVFTLTGDDRANYITPDGDDTHTMTITKRMITVYGTTVDNRVYDGTDNAFGQTHLHEFQADGVTKNFTHIVDADYDKITVTIVSSVFSDRHAGTGKAVTIVYGVEGEEAGNYDIQGNNCVADITPASLVITDNVPIDKPYDGGASVDISSQKVTGIFQHDEDGSMVDDYVSIVTIAYIINTNAGTGKTVYFNYATSGADADDYVVSDASEKTVTGYTVTPLAIELVDKNITYNNKADSIEFDLAGIGKDVLTIRYTSSEHHAGTYTYVVTDGARGTFTVEIIDGNPSGNYVLPASSDAEFIIDPIVLDVQSAIVGTEKVYDGTVNAPVEVVRKEGILPGDKVDVLVAGFFADKHVGTGKTVTVVYTMVGEDQDNYIGPSGTTLTMTIVPKVISVTGTTVADKVYDALTDAVATMGTITVIDGDVVILSVDSANFSDRHAGKDKDVTVVYTLSGADAANYSVGNDVIKATIEPKVVTSDTTVLDKTYDGTTVANAKAGSVIGLIGADQMSVTGTTATFDGISAGTHDVLVRYEWNNTDYVIEDLTVSAEILKKHIVVTATAANKVFDGLAATEVSLSDYSGSIIAGDNVTVTATAAFADVNAGTSKLVNVTYVIAGDAKDNYDIEAGRVFANIDPKDLSEITFTNVGDPVYDRTEKSAPFVLEYKSAGLTLAPGTDYSTIRGEHTEVGVYTTIFIGVGNYTGHRDMSWNILDRMITVTFDAAGGMPVPSEDDYCLDKPYGILPGVFKEGYSFVGWFDGEKPVTISTVMDHTEAFTLTAHWSVNTYTVIYEVKGAAVVMMKEYEYNTLVTIEPPFVMEGYTVTPWSVTEDFLMPAEDVVITAIATVNKYGFTVNYLDKAGKEVATATTGTMEYGSTYEGLLKSVIGYTAPESKFISIQTDVSKNVIDYVYTPIAYHVTYKIDGQQYGDVEMHDYNTQVTVRDKFVKEGYNVSDWSRTDFIMPAEDVTIVATTHINSYDYVVNYLNEHGAAIADKKTGEAVFGTTVEGTVLDIEGYTAPAKQSITIVVDESKNVINYVYTINSYTVTYLVDGKQVGEVETYDFNEHVTVRAHYEKTGYTVTPWSRTDFTMPARDVEISATTTVNSYGFTINYLDSEGKAVAEATTGTSVFGTTVEGTLKTVTGYILPEMQSMVISAVESENVISYTYYLDSFTIIFDANGGTVIGAESRDYVYSKVYGELSGAEWAGYTFAGWFTNDHAGTQVTAEDRQMFTRTTTLYAHWAPLTYTVTFNGNGGSAPSFVSKVVTSGQPYGELATTEFPGHSFMGWYTAPSGGNQITSVSKVAIAEDHVLYAHWDALFYTALFKENGADGGTDVDPLNAIVGVPFPAPECTWTKTGYIFTAWKVTVDGEDRFYKPGDDMVDLTLVDRAFVPVLAMWTAGTYTVTFDANGGVEPVPATKEVTFGDRYGELAATSKLGVLFDGWYTEKTGGKKIESYDIVDVAADQTLYAHWSAVDFIISLVQPDHGLISIVGHEDVVDNKYRTTYGDELVFVYTSTEGYRLVSWHNINADGTLFVTGDVAVSCDDSDVYYLTYQVSETDTQVVEQHYGEEIRLIDRLAPVAVQGGMNVFRQWTNYTEIVQSDMHILPEFLLVHEDTTISTDVDMNNGSNLDMDTIDEIIDEGCEYVILHGEKGDIKVAVATLKAMASNGEVRIDVVFAGTSDYTPAQKQQIRNNTVLSITAFNGEEKVHKLSAPVLVSFHHVLRDGYTVDDIGVYYVNENGNLEEMNGVTYDAETQTLSFYTDHFSLFMVKYPNENSELYVLAAIFLGLTISTIIALTVKIRHDRRV